MLNYIQGLTSSDSNRINKEYDQIVEKYEAFSFTEKDEEKLYKLVLNLSNRKFLLEHLIKLRDLNNNDSQDIKLKRAKFDYFTKNLEKIILCNNFFIVFINI